MKSVTVAAIVLALVGGGPALAHHSYAAYHTDRLIEIDGVLEALEWVNPHTLLKIRAADAFYTVEWRGASAMPRWVGIGSDWLKPGDRLIVTGNPRRDLAESGVVNLKSITRPADGWMWPRR